MSDKPEEKTIYQEALRQWGQDAQEDMILEEMAELTKAILKYRRKRIPRYQNKVIEELVDVAIMLEQMKIIYDYDGIFNEMKERKLKRVADMLEEIRSSE